MKEISKEEFERYEEVRVGGRTNMFMVSNVEALSGLDEETIMAIIKNYSELKEKFIEVEGEKEIDEKEEVKADLFRKYGE